MYSCIFLFQCVEDFFGKLRVRVFNYNHIKKQFTKNMTVCSRSLLETFMNE